MICGQVDLVAHPVQPELNGFVGCALVKVVEESDDGSLRHGMAFRYAEWVPFGKPPECVARYADPEQNEE